MWVLTVLKENYILILTKDNVYGPMMYHIVVNSQPQIQTSVQIVMQIVYTGQPMALALVMVNGHNGCISIAHKHASGQNVGLQRNPLPPRPPHQNHQYHVTASATIHMKETAIDTLNATLMEHGMW